MKEVLNILAIDDVPMFIDGLTALLKSKLPHCSVSSANNFDEVKAILSQKAFQLILLDLDLRTSKADGFQIAHYIKEHYPDSKIIVLTVFVKVDHIERLYPSYVQSYLDKQLDPETLLLAIEEVMKGNTYLPEDIKTIIANGHMFQLSDRQREVITLLAKGLTKKEVAESLFVSYSTIDSHVRSLFDIFQVNSTHHLCSLYIAYLNSNSENLNEESNFKQNKNG